MTSLTSSINGCDVNRVGGDRLGPKITMCAGASVDVSRTRLSSTLGLDININLETWLQTPSRALTVAKMLFFGLPSPDSLTSGLYWNGRCSFLCSFQAQGVLGKATRSIAVVEYYVYHRRRQRERGTNSNKKRTRGGLRHWIGEKYPKKGRIRKQKENKWSGTVVVCSLLMLQTTDEKAKIRMSERASERAHGASIAS